MSRFSGKCDFCDHIDIHGADSVLSSDIYIGRNIIPLRFQTEKDLIPYYPHLITVSAYNKESNRSHICLSEDSFVDREEEEILTYTLQHLLRYYNRCKRKHIQYDVDEAIKNNLGGWFKPEYYKVLAERVGRLGKKATIEGIHTDLHQHDRQLLYEEMVKNGYSPWTAWYWVYHEYNSDLIKEN